MVMQNERVLLDMFINKIKLVDPDVIVCHGLTNGIFEVLMNRI
jgi:DNA polymerase elongation subunit (family B)